MERVLVIGGVAAGLSAASRVRRLAPGTQVTVVERGPAAGYSACGLPYFLAGQVPSLEALRAHPEDFFRARRGIELLLGHEALEIEPARRRVRVRGAEGERWLSYDRLVIATGATARWQPRSAPDGPLRNVFAANTWTEAQALEAALRTGELRRIAVVGGGYIGLEVAEALAQRGGLKVTLLHAQATLLPGFEPEMVQELPARLEAAGVQVRLGVRVLGLDGPRGGRVLALDTTEGRLETDAVVNCAGLRPEVGLAAAAGVALGPTGAIAVDDRQQTNLAGVFAAGDCAESRHRVSGAPVWIPLGAVANQQGRIAGVNAAGASLGGRPARYPGVLGTLAVPLGGAEWGRTGLSREQARAHGLAAETVAVESISQAAYMKPESIHLHLVYERSGGRLLGCHLRGGPGTVAGRLDTAAAALSAGLTLDQVESLDLAYSPALAPLYEPLQVAAHQALRR